MAKWIGAATLAAALTFGGSVAVSSAAAAPAPTKVQKLPTRPTADLGAQRRIRLDPYQRGVYRPVYRSYYYDRPTYYAPAPFFPLLGLGYGPWW